MVFEIWFYENHDTTTKKPIDFEKDHEKPHEYSYIPGRAMHLSFRNGKKNSVVEFAHTFEQDQGTSVKIMNLFHNVPVRYINFMLYY